MFEPGSILHGNFELQATTRGKYCIVIHADIENSNNLIITTFTTSRQRSGVLNPVHGKNISPQGHTSYVFLHDKVVGKNPDGSDFSFFEDTTVVSDYGFMEWTVEGLNTVDGITKVGSLSKKEYVDMIYALYQADKTPNKYKSMLEGILEQILKK